MTFLGFLRQIAEAGLGKVCVGLADGPKRFRFVQEDYVIRIPSALSECARWSDRYRQYDSRCALNSGNVACRPRGEPTER